MELPSRGLARSASFTTRAARFEDVPELLRIIGRAVEHGCLRHYDANQRRAVYLNYAQFLFVEAQGRSELVAAEVDGRLMGVAQLDPVGGRLMALFVDGDYQGSGLGRALLADVERRAAARRLPRLHGAMALNAVRFYAAAGFRPYAGPMWLAASSVPVPVVPMEKSLRR
jgi:N-acetylglutamate synthase-like GNAT family acetyltransferase